MSAWLAFVVGIIAGLLIGWVIELIYSRRTHQARSPEPVEPVLAVPEVDEPQASTPVAVDASPTPGDQE